MKILFPLRSYYPSQSGGPNNTIYWHARALCNKGIIPIVVTTDSGIKEGSIILNKWCVIKGVKVIYTIKHFNLPINYICYSLLELNKCNIVQFSSLFYWPNIIIALFALFKNKKIVWSPRGELSKNALIYGSKFKQLYVRLVNLIPSKNIYFHATSEEEVNQISNNIFNKNEIIQLPNGILLSKYFGYELEYYFLFLGRIHPIKALDNLILALSKSEIFIKSKFKLKIAGRIDTSVTTKRYYNLLSELIKNNKLEHKIEWDGFVDQTKDVVLSKAFFLILPSHTENFGNVVIESMSQGTPVIASKGTPWEILEKYNAGMWVNNDTESLMKAINKAISLDQGKYLEMRRNAYNLVRERYNINTLIENWIEVYKKITTN